MPLHAPVPDRKRRLRKLRRLATAPVAILAALILAFEEWLWEPLARLMTWLGRRPPVSWIEAGLRALPGPLALLAFAVPALALLPIKIAALALIGAGHSMSGLVMFIAAKIVGTAALAWVWGLTSPQLLSMPWFTRLHTRFLALRRMLYDLVFRHPMVIATLRRVRAWRETIRARRRQPR